MKASTSNMGITSAEEFLFWDNWIFILLVLQFSRGLFFIINTI